MLSKGPGEKNLLNEKSYYNVICLLHSVVKKQALYIRAEYLLGVRDRYQHTVKCSYSVS
jgi:hypothetical protein